MKIGQLVKYKDFGGRFYIYTNPVDTTWPSTRIEYGQIGMFVMRAKRGENVSGVYLFGDKLVPLAHCYVEPFHGGL